MPVNYVAMLLEVMQAYALCDRHPDLAQYEMMAQLGQLSQNMAKVILYQLQDVIQESEDFPNFLHRPPSEEQINEEGKPDIEIGNLIEGEQLRFGLRILDRPRHVICAGSTGSGKTTSIRKIILAIHELNKLGEQSDEEEKKLDRV